VGAQDQVQALQETQVVQAEVVVRVLVVPVVQVVRGILQPLPLLLFKATLAVVVAQQLTEAAEEVVPTLVQVLAQMADRKQQGPVVMEPQIASQALQ
jgi:hypothetical protein